MIFPKIYNRKVEWNAYSKLFILTTFFLLFSPCLEASKAQSSEPFEKLIGTSWKAVKFGNEPITSHHPTLKINKKLPEAYLRIEEEKKELDKFKDALEGGFEGTSFCNFYTAVFKARGQILRLFSISRTLMICYPLKRIENETRYDKLFNQITSWRLENGRLFLHSKKTDQTIHFVQVETTHLNK